MKFYTQTWLGGSTHITMPNFLEAGLSKVYPNQTYCNFSNFQNVCCQLYLGFLKLGNFIGYFGGEGRDAAARQIQLKWVNRL